MHHTIICLRDKMVKLTLAIVALCLLGLVNAQVLSPAIPVRRDGAVKGISGITDCGVGRLVDVRIAGCSSAPCTISAGQPYKIEADFAPRDMHWIMRFAMVAHKDSQLHTIFQENGLPDSTIQAGQLYTFAFDLNANPSFRGRADVRLELHENWAQELCLIIPVNYV